MTALTTTPATTAQAPAPGSAARPRFRSLRHALVLAKRNLIKITRTPEQLIDVTLQPIIFLLLFVYVFGGAISGGSHHHYLQFLLPGLMGQSIAMGSIALGQNMNADIEKGVFDRFRTLPVWRPAALVGMIFGDVLRYILAATTIMVVGLILGFRPEGGVVGVIAGIALLVVFSFAFSWVWTMFGLFLRSEKSVMGVSMLVLFPLTFLSNVFVEPSTMPGWLQGFVSVNPVSHLVTAIRSVMAGSWNMGEVLWTLIASAALVAVFGTITMRLYNRK